MKFTKQEPFISFLPVDSIRNTLGFIAGTLYEEYNLSPNSVVISSFDNFFFVCEFATGMIFRGKRSGIVNNFTMDVDPGYKNIEKLR